MYKLKFDKFINLFGALHRFQHCTGHITTGSWKGRGNQYIQFVRVLYCKLPTNGKQLPAFPLEAVPGTEPWPQRWEASVTTLPPWPPVKFDKKVTNEYIVPSLVSITLIYYVAYLFSTDGSRMRNFHFNYSREFK